MKDLDDVFIQAEEELKGELERDPTDDEIAERAFTLLDDLSARAYDRAKDRWKDGDC